MAARSSANENKVFGMNVRSHGRSHAKPAEVQGKHESGRGEVAW